MLANMCLTSIDTVQKSGRLVSISPWLILAVQLFEWQQALRVLFQFVSVDATWQKRAGCGDLLHFHSPALNEAYVTASNTKCQPAKHAGRGDY